MGIIIFFGWLGMGIGAWVGGFIFDLAGSYVWSYAVAAGGGVVNLLILCGFRFVLSGGGYSRSPSLLVRQ